MISSDLYLSLHLVCRVATRRPRHTFLDSPLTLFASIDLYPSLHSILSLSHSIPCSPPNDHTSFFLSFWACYCLCLQKCDSFLLILHLWQNFLELSRLVPVPFLSRPARRAYPNQKQITLYCNYLVKFPQVDFFHRLSLVCSTVTGT